MFCNRCLLFAEDALPRGLKFHITNCGHVYCQDCNEACINPECFACGSKSARSVVINNDLHDTVKICFTSSKAILGHLDRAFNFREYQMRLFEEVYEKNISSLTKQYHQLKTEVDAFEKAVAAEKHKAETIEAENAKLREEIAKVDMESEMLMRGMMTPSPNFNRSLCSPTVARKRSSSRTSLQFDLYGSGENQRPPSTFKIPHVYSNSSNPMIPGKDAWVPGIEQQPSRHVGPKLPKNSSFLTH